MGRSQADNGFAGQINALIQRVESLERVVNQSAARSIATTGLTSAQIDTLVFGANQPFDGIVIIDPTAGRLLARLGDKWGYVTLSIIT